ncbi:MAG: EAL domain-containing protein [Clostridiales bacterium]|nr:EAL domain-containing protein [Clostridiales bacterium]
MRYSFAVLFVMMILALLTCISVARRSHKKIKVAVVMLLAMLIPPMIGNLIIVLSTAKIPAMIGCYVYFIGMDAVIMALLFFTFQYCAIKWPSNKLKYLVYGLVTADIVQYALNPFFGHAFDTEPILVDNRNYYRLLPYSGQTYHRIVVYGIFFTVLLIFLIKMIRSSRVYTERYAVILITMFITGAWQSYYIFSRTPVEKSMAGYGIFGILVFYFTIYYRPLTLLDRLLANMASDMPDAIFFYDADGTCIWANKPAIELVGLKDEKFDKSSELLQAKFGQKDDFDTPEWSCNKVIGHGQEAKYYYQSKRTARDEKGRVTGSFLTIRDTTREQRILQQERYNATHDSLTDLFTKEFLYESIRKKLDENPDKEYMIHYIDIQDFKLINDVYGNEFGDRALKSLAKFLRDHVPADGVFGRIGGDTFGVLVPKEAFVEQQLEEALMNFSMGDGPHDHHIVIHVGVYEVIERNMEVSFMFDRALLAMSTIDDEYRTHIAIYDEKIRKDVLWAQHISGQLKEALKQRNVLPYLQPIVDTRGRIVGAEALARWIHPQDGFLSPAEFIPVFEKNGMIIEIDRHMWRCACEILSDWAKQGLDLFISVNISPKDFYFMDVASEIKALAKEYGIDHSKLRIEITETVMMTDVENRMKVLDDLRKDGFIVEMDDFGSGYSSLNLLKDMPVDVLKIDMRFLTSNSDDMKARTILQNIINLSEDLGMFSLTEGVETKSQLEMLSEMGCKLFQGYYFAKPLPLDDFNDFLKSQSA